MASPLDITTLEYDGQPMQMLKLIYKITSI